MDRKEALEADIQALRQEVDELYAELAAKENDVESEVEAIMMEMAALIEERDELEKEDE